LKERGKKRRKGPLYRQAGLLKSVFTCYGEGIEFGVKGVFEDVGLGTGHTVCMMRPMHES